MTSIASPSGAIGPTPLDLKARVRAPLLAAVALIAAIDFIGLGMHLADSKNDAANGEPAPQARARTSVTAPNAVVDSSSIEAATPSNNRTRTSSNTGGFVGPVAPPVVSTPPSGGGSPAPAPTPAPAVPLAQAGAGVPALGVNASVGLGDGGCTTVDLTLLALGDCPAPEGDGAVILQLGGSLFGN